MGEYRNGKWTPTFGDEQFGVVDSPGQMYNRVRELEAKIERLEAALAKSCEEGRAEMYDCGFNGLKAENERLRAALEVCEVPVKRQRKEIERYKAVVDAARDFINNPHSTRTAIRIFDALAELDADDDA